MILALDFDGVLHPVKTTTELKFCRLEMLEAWLREHADVDVIISSSWREVHSFDLMQSFFSDDLQSRVVGATPVLRSHAGPATRHAEIESWVASSEEPSRPWLALDDDPGMFEESFQGAVFCDPNLGLEQRALARLSEAVEESTGRESKP
jgi:hypothetical protein